MSLAGFLCDANDLPVTIEACLACARSGALPGCHQTAPVITGIVRGLRPDDFGLTVTTLIGCLRKARLMHETRVLAQAGPVLLGLSRPTDARRRRALCRRRSARHRRTALHHDDRYTRRPIDRGERPA